MSRSLSATDQTMAEYFAALMSEEEPLTAALSVETTTVPPATTQAAEVVVAVAVEPATLGQDGGAVTIHLYAPAFASQPALQIMGICLGADPLGHAPILLVLLLVAPAVEVEVHQPQLPLAIANEDAAGIPQPDVIHLGVDEVGVALAA